MYVYLRPVVPRALVLVRRRRRRRIVASRKRKVSAAQHGGHGVARVQVDCDEPLGVGAKAGRPQVVTLRAPADEEARRAGEARGKPHAIDELRVELGHAREQRVELGLEPADERCVGRGADEATVEGDPHQLLAENARLRRRVPQPLAYRRKDRRGWRADRGHSAKPRDKKRRPLSSKKKKKKRQADHI